jgi:hypothetical protein
MMYNQKLSACIKANGRVLREVGDKVYIPFGAEYAIGLRNLNTVRAEVSIELDGKDIGNVLILNAGQSVDLERFLTNNTSGNRFKFIERSSSVEQHRGIGAEDGLVRITFAFEQRAFVQPQPTYWNGGIIRSGVSNDFFGSNSIKCSATHDSYIAPQTLSQAAAAVNQAGITAPGSISNQKFHEAAAFLTGPKEVMVFHLLGETESAKVVQPVTVKHKPECVSCGRKNKATAKFCVNCGTVLHII